MNGVKESYQSRSNKVGASRQLKVGKNGESY